MSLHRPRKWLAQQITQLLLNHLFTSSGASVLIALLPPGEVARRHHGICHPRGMYRGQVLTENAAHTGLLPLGKLPTDLKDESPPHGAGFLFGIIFRELCADIGFETAMRLIKRRG